MIELINQSVPFVTVLIAIIAVVFLVSGIDDLLMDLFYAAWRLYRRFVFSHEHKMLSNKLLLARPQQPIAVMIPTWHEAGVIGETLAYAIRTLRYDNYMIFVGVYRNDAETRAAVARVAQLHPDRIRVVEVDHDGPTNKANCLNGIINHIMDYEQRQGFDFGIFVLDDAEDIMPQHGLLVFNYLVPRKDFVQLPVFPAKVPWWQFTAGHYLDEFAQLHVKDMRTREWLTGTIPSAGVGAAFSRKAIKLARQANHGQVFSERTLTEDYELPLQLARYKLSEAFVEPDGPLNGDGPPLEEHYPYVRSYFPRKLRDAVRQKSRWVLGISLQGWEHLGWRGKGLQDYMLWRDRKVLIGNLANFLGYILVVFTLGIWLAKWGLSGDDGFPNVVPPGSFIWKLLVVNFVIMAILLAVRFACTLKIYGLFQAILSVPRAVWGNFVNFLATARALFLFFRARRRGGKPIPWEKTEHEFHASL